MIVWFTGNSGAGKSTLAKAVRQHFRHAVWLDGDAMRAPGETCIKYILKQAGCRGFSCL